MSISFFNFWFLSTKYEKLKHAFDVEMFYLNQDLDVGNIPHEKL